MKKGVVVFLLLLMTTVAVDLDKLYEEYGKAAVALELAQNSYNQAKARLANKLNEQPKKEEKK